MPIRRQERDLDRLLGGFGVENLNTRNANQEETLKTLSQDLKDVAARNGDLEAQANTDAAEIARLSTTFTELNPLPGPSTIYPASGKVVEGMFWDAIERAKKAEAEVEEWKARAIKAEEAARSSVENLKARGEQLAIPLLPADFVEMLAQRFVKMVDEPSGQRGAVALRLAEDAATFLRGERAVDDRLRADERLLKAFEGLGCRGHVDLFGLGRLAAGGRVDRAG